MSDKLFFKTGRSVSAGSPARKVNYCYFSRMLKCSFFGEIPNFTMNFCTLLVMFLCNSKFEFGILGERQSSTLSETSETK